MQSYNLTEKQKAVLRWMVQEVRAGKLEEGQIWIQYHSDGISIPGYHGQVPEFYPNVLAILRDNELIDYYLDGSLHKCALRGRAYEAVDSDFGGPDRTALTHLIPLQEVSHLDEEIAQRCLLSVSADGRNPKAWDKAVRTAVVILEERLREIGNVDDVNPDATGTTIVNKIFGGNGDFKNRLGSDKNRAYRDLYAGVMAIFRNRYAHRLVDPSPEEGGAVIVFIDLLLKMLDDLGRLPDSEEKPDLN
jgi:hypothetical protein